MAHRLQNRPKYGNSTDILKHDRKPDGKTRIFFAIAACVTFYLWIAFLVVDSVYCFGFLAHQGPCANATAAAAAASSNDSSSRDDE